VNDDLSFILSYIEAEGMEKTFKFRQDDIVSYVDDRSAKKVIQDQLTNP
jgi:hypothetical protein